MPQRRRRTYIVGYRQNSVIAGRIERTDNWVLYDGVLAQAFPFEQKKSSFSSFVISGTIQEVSEHFNKEKKASPFGDAGMMVDRRIYSVDALPVYEGTTQTLGNILVDESFVPEDFFISN